MSNKIYNFDFYECRTISSDSTARPMTASDIFRQLNENKDSGVSTVRQLDRIDYEIREITPTEFGFRGIIGKHRKSDLPHAAIVDGAEREIELADDENLLEKTHFHFYEDYQLIILQKNHYGINNKRFGRYLSSGTYVTTLNPVIEPSDLQLLLHNRIQLRSIEVAIARPRNQELFRNVEHDFNNTIVSTLRGTGSATLKIEARGDARSNDPESRYLQSSIKRALREMQSTFDVKKCQLLLEDQDQGITHPVDLVCNRLKFQKQIHVEGRYPQSFEMWTALTEARVNKEAELQRYFGSLDGQRLA